MPARKKRKAPAKKSKKQTSPKRPRLKPLSLLILECDANNLSTQGLAVGSELNAVIKFLAALFPDETSFNAELALINSQDDLKKHCAEYAEKYSSIKLIAVVAHSNRDVISVAPDMVLEWDVFGAWMQPFKPVQMVFVACEAGQYPSTRTLFDKVEQLTAIYASPIKASKAHVEVIKLLVPYLLLNKKHDSDLIRIAQIINFMRNGGIILRCSRRNGEWTSLLQFLLGLGE